MYPQQAFRETRDDVLDAFVRAHPLGLLISGGADGPLATPIPFDLVVDDDGRRTLRGHLTRGNPQAEAIRSAGAVLTVFQGAAANVSPGWYPSKQEHGRVVPTWNYVMVEARGTARMIDDPAWLRDQVEALTEARERDRAAPWAVGDAPDAFVAAQLRGIVGVEIELRSFEGRWKASQNRSAADRAGVAAGLGREPDGAAMAAIVAAAGAPHCPFAPVPSEAAAAAPDASAVSWPASSGTH